MDTGENSSAIGTSSNGKKRKKPAAKGDVLLEEEEDGDLRRLFSKKRLFNMNIPVPILIKSIFDLLRRLIGRSSNVCCSCTEVHSTRLWNPLMNMILFVARYGMNFWILQTRFRNLSKLYIRCAHTLSSLSENKTLGDCCGKAIEHMLKLLVSNIIIQDDEYSGFPWRKERKRPVYNMPEELVCKLRPYSTFLKWLQEDGWEEVLDEKVSSDYNEQHKFRARLIAEILSCLSDKVVTRIGAQKMLHTVHLCVGQLKSNHEVIHGRKSKGKFKNQQR